MSARVSGGRTKARTGGASDVRLHGVHGNPGESLVGAERLLRAVGRHRLFGLLFALVLLRFPAAERESLPLRRESRRAESTRGPLHYE